MVRGLGLILWLSLPAPLCSLEISSSQGGTSKAAAVEAEEADASSVGPGDTHSAASLRQQQGWLVAGKHLPQRPGMR